MNNINNFRLAEITAKNNNFYRSLKSAYFITYVLGIIGSVLWLFYNISNYDKYSHKNTLSILEVSLNTWVGPLLYFFVVSVIFSKIFLFFAASIYYKELNYQIKLLEDKENLIENEEEDKLC